MPAVIRSERSLKLILGRHNLAAEINRESQNYVEEGGVRMRMNAGMSEFLCFRSVELELFYKSMHYVAI